MRPAVLITGGARRIGAAIASAFGEAGWHVVIHHRASHDEAEALAGTLASAECVECDLGDSEAAVAMVTDLAGRLEDWRMLVNCAAVFHEDSAQALDPSVFDEAMAVNAEAPVRMTQAFLARAQARRGRRVIHVTDMKLSNPNPDFLSYTMSKHALAASVRMLAMAQERPEDRVYAIAPGAILASHDQREEEVEVSHRLNLLGRKTGADEIAGAALFLAQGWLASGETIFVDSGQHLLSQRRDVLYLARE
jgi:NAD(P)-dependent dehydrogenase (short-subunit alcohol dehydrogenase family)